MHLNNPNKEPIPISVRVLMVCLAAMVFALLPFSVSLPAGAETPLSLLVYPSKVTLELKPGEQKTMDLNVVNRGDADMHIVSNINDYYYKPAGDKVFLPPGKLPSSGARWISMNPVEFDIAGGKSQAVRCTIDVPATATGSVNSVIFFQSRPIRSSMHRGVAISLRIGTLMLVEVQGTVSRSGKIVDMKANKSTPRAPMSISVIYLNTGNAYSEVKGRLEIVDAAGKIVTHSDIASETVLPSEKRLLRAVPPTKLPPNV